MLINDTITDHSLAGEGARNEDHRSIVDTVARNHIECIKLRNNPPTPPTPLPLHARLTHTWLEIRRGHWF